MFILNFPNIETINYAQDCTSYASPCRDVTTNSSPLNSLPEAIIRLDEDGSEVIGSECRGLDTNHDTTAYLTRIQVSKDISSWIVGLFFSSLAWLLPAKDCQSVLRKLMTCPIVLTSISAETSAEHEYRSKDTPAPAQGAGCLIKHDGFIRRELLL